MTSTDAIAAGDGLRQRTLSGLRWMAMSQVIVQVVRFAVAALLARLVSPPEFGLFQMAVVFTGFAAVLCDAGLGAALIQRPQLSPAQINGAFWLNVGISGLVALVLVAAGHAVAAFYHQPAVAPVLRVCALDFVLGALGSVHRSMLMRELRYDGVARAEIIGCVAGSLLALVLAVRGTGVWSLVALAVGTTLGTTILLWRACPWRPQGVRHVHTPRELLHFGLHLQGFNLLNYLLRNLDKALIGRTLGELLLGHYTRAYSTMLLPQSQLTAVLERVMWPALARCNGDLPRLRKAYLRALSVVCFVATPLLAGLLVTAPDFIRALYGREWMDCVTTLRWLCLVGITQVPVATTGWIYLATGRTRRLFGWGVGAGVVTVACMAVGVLSGSIDRVAQLLAAGALVLLPAAFCVAFPCVGLPLRAAWPPVTIPFLLSGIMAGAAWGVQTLLPAGWPAILRLLCTSGAGAATYAGLALMLRLRVIDEARELFFRSRGAPAPFTSTERPS